MIDQKDERKVHE